MIITMRLYIITIMKNIGIQIHLYKYMCENTIGDMQYEKYFYDHYNEFVYNHDYKKFEYKY